MEQGLEPPTLRVGNLEARRDMLDARDVVRAYRLLMARGVPGSAYNIALGRPISIRDLLDTLRRLSRIPTDVTTDPARMRPADIPCSTGDPSRLYAETGWTPAYPLETTLRDTLDYWRTVTATTEKAQADVQ
jgi:GDP-4-dehydro-6-deoxy-D-mannose reductase